MSYSNSAISIHGTCRPPITMSLTATDVTRSGNTISTKVTASLNDVSGYHWMSYYVKVYAQLNDGTKVLIIDKANGDSQWGNGHASTGTKTVSVTSTSTDCTLKIWMETNCYDCLNGGTSLVKSISLKAPSATKYTLTLKKGTGVSAFTGGGSFQPSSKATTKATAATGYKLKSYSGTATDGTSKTWTDCSGKTTHSMSWTMTRNRTITVSATANTYSIIYKANGGSGSMSNQSVTYNKSVTPKSNTFTRSGYTFKGWNTKADGTGTNRNSAWTYKTAGNTTLYAIWSKVPYKITYDANGGSNAPKAQTKYAGKAVTITSSKPTGKSIKITFNPNGGTVNPTSATKTLGFHSWNTKADGTGTRYNPGATYNVDKDLKLYAIWSGTAISLPTPSRTSCKFVGWYTSVDGGSQVTTKTTFKASKTIYARWDYLIRYHLNGGNYGEGTQSADILTQTYKHHNVALTITSLKPTKKGYVFKGWAESKTATEPTYLPGGKYTKNNPDTLYAVYAVPIYTVKFDLCGGKQAAGDTTSLTQKVKSGQDATLPKDPVRTNRVFGGWLGNYKNVTSNRTIKAMWVGTAIWIQKSDKKWHPLI